jgi:hypothetical protein
MALAHNPSIVTDSLVFAYDMGPNPGVNKSWKGAPTTNLITASLNGMQGVSLTFLGLENGWKKYAMSGTFTAGTYPYTMNMTSTSFTGGVTYSSSCYIKTNVAYKFNYFATGMNYVNQPMTKGGTSFSIAQPDGSFYIGRSNFAYTSTTTQTGFILTNPINNTTFNAATDFVWFKNGQVELGEFPTPFAGDSATRSNTQSLLDWTGNNTITANSLTYNSDGSFSFTSASNYASIGYNPEIDLVNTVTLEAWLKYTTSTNTVCIEKSSNNTHYQFQIFASNQGAGIGGDIVFMLQPNSSNWVTAGLALNNNQWHHVIGTYDRTTTTARIYVDGALRNTNSAIATGPTTNTQPLLIGSRSGTAGFGGTIGVAKIYNRALTAVEVQQNFNALRGRYGI